MPSATWQTAELIEVAFAIDLSFFGGDHGANAMLPKT
jgi:hypothetical protein